MQFPIKKIIGRWEALRGLLFLYKFDLRDFSHFPEIVVDYSLSVPPDKGSSAASIGLIIKEK